jgi:hypothetical protein
MCKHKIEGVLCYLLALMHTIAGTYCAFTVNNIGAISQLTGAAFWFVYAYVVFTRHDSDCGSVNKEAP